MPHAATAADPVVRILLYLHIACGFAAFVFAPVALLTAKGQKAHRLWGKMYFWAMAGVAITALVLSILLPIVFLALVSVFSFYSAFAAYRVLYLKDLSKGGRPQAIDWAAGLLTFGASLGLLILGVARPYLMRIGVVVIAGMPISVVSVAFGILGIVLSCSTMKHFVFPPRDRMFWWYAHMRGMIASYIAAWTAFSAVNLGQYFGPAWWVWLWPTLVGTPAIAIWIRYYKVKFGGRGKRKQTDESNAVP